MSETASAPFSVLAPTSLADWSRRVETTPELFLGECFGRVRLAAKPPPIVCSPPILFKDEDAAFFPPSALQGPADYPVPELRLDCIPDAQIIGEQFIVVSSDRRIFSESYWSDENLDRCDCLRRIPLRIAVDGREVSLPLVLYKQRPPTRRIDEPLFLLGNPWRANYHHWVINCLGRLWYLDQFPELERPPLLVPKHLSPFQTDSLKALGVEEHRLIRQDEGTIHSDQLLFPANGDFSTIQLSWIRDRVLGFLGIDRSATKQWRRIYISRSDAPSRRVVNEEGVQSLLARFGFETFRLSEMSFLEQAALFAATEIVIGPHGSGLTNILFGPDRLTLLEINPADDRNHVFYVMASALGQRYAFLSGKIEGANRDFRVDVAQLEHAIRRLLG